MNRTILFLSALIIMSPTFSIQAAERPLSVEATLPRIEGIDLSDGISAAEAVRIGLRENFGLLAIRKAQQTASGDVWKAKILSEPELRMGLSRLDEDAKTSSWAHDYDISLRWTPPRPGERSLKESAALGKLAETAGDIQIAEQRLAAEILYLHTKAAFFEEKAILAEQSARLRRDMVDFVNSQVSAQTKTLLDLNVAELALADARSLPEAFRMEQRLSLNRLATELNLSPTIELKLQKEPPLFGLNPRELDLQHLVEVALLNRPELLIANARNSEARSSLELAKNERFPWFSFFQVGREFGIGSASSSWGLRFGIDLPVFKWNNRLLQSPSATLEKTQLELAYLKRTIGLEVEQVVAQLQTHYSGLKHFDSIVNALLQNGIALSEQSVNLGQTDQLQYLLAKAQQLQRRQNYLTDLLECRRLEIELDRATGTVIPKQIQAGPK
jgi:outer membrane protein TolC